MARIDLRSDTVTRPTAAMRQAMAAAEVGDDVYGEDPSVNRLQERAAELLGKEAALFVPTGTMANQAALRVLTRPGDVALAGTDAHILLYEGGATSALWGVQVQTIGSGGFFDAVDVRRAVHPDDAHFAPTRVVCFENPHTKSGGCVFPLERLKDATRAARELGLRLHLDGARLFNAVVASGTPADAWADPFDTVSFCLSKGLGAPVGSLLCGSAELIHEAHRARKMLGGGMRQAGILAAAGLHALDHHIDRLAEDHANARRLAEELEQRGFEVDPPPETNAVIFRPEDAPGFLRAAEERELLLDLIADDRLRAMTHLDAGRDAIDAALERIDALISEGIR